MTPDQNRRRRNLIARRHSSGLTAEEAAELDVLQAAAERWVDERCPLPIEELEALWESLGGAGVVTQQRGQPDSA